jgi:hypothetical protein
MRYNAEPEFLATHRFLSGTASAIALPPFDGAGRRRRQCRLASRHRFENLVGSRIAHWVEQSSDKRRVAGSTPASQPGVASKTTSPRGESRSRESDLFGASGLPAGRGGADSTRARPTRIGTGATLCSRADSRRNVNRHCPATLAAECVNTPARQAGRDMTSAAAQPRLRVPLRGTPAARIGSARFFCLLCVRHVGERESRGFPSAAPLYRKVGDT